MADQQGGKEAGGNFKYDTEGASEAGKRAARILAAAAASQVRWRV